jgi:folylpolyglutamate synthase/dihydropteroate synthase
MAERREGEPLVVCGSLFLIAVVREILTSLPSETVALK